MTGSDSLRSAPVPAVGADEHVRGSGEVVVIEYGDYECPYCAKADLLLADLGVQRVFRHFPVVSKHPRAQVLACAAEAAGLQGRFWEMHDSLFADQGRLDPPHLWQRCRDLGIDLDAFEVDRRSDAVSERVKRDFRSGIRAGVTTTPTLWVAGRAYPGVPDVELLAQLTN